MYGETPPIAVPAPVNSVPAVPKVVPAPANPVPAAPMYGDTPPNVVCACPNPATAGAAYCAPSPPIPACAPVNAVPA